MKSKKKPQTESEWAAYRCRVDCDIAMEAIDGKTPLPRNCSLEIYTTYLLFHAIKDLSKQIELLGGKK